MLYATYQNFLCKVRVGGKYSVWYKMECSIRQGGFLSLLKYTAFIDPLLRQIEQAGHSISVGGIPTNPVGYADDMASACMSKTIVDKTLTMVNNHAKTWRYAYLSLESHPLNIRKILNTEMFAWGRIKCQKKTIMIT